MKTTLEEIKDEIAKEKGYIDWLAIRNGSDLNSWEKIDLCDKVAERHAHKALEEAAEKGKSLESDREKTDYWRGYNHAINIYKESILSLKDKY